MPDGAMDHFVQAVRQDADTILQTVLTLLELWEDVLLEAQFHLAASAQPGWEHQHDVLEEIWLSRSSSDDDSAGSQDQPWTDQLRLPRLCTRELLLLVSPASRHVATAMHLLLAVATAAARCLDQRFMAET